MPGRDTTGPMGAGAASGRGLGQCLSSGLGLGGGLGRGQGFGRGFKNFTNNRMITPLTKEQLLIHKSILQSRINQIDKTLENM